MLLKKIIKKCPKILEDLKVKGLSSDTRTLKKGDLYFALKGDKFNGEKFIKLALKKGAVAVVTTKKLKKEKNIISVNNVKKTLVFACSSFYNNKPKNIIAVTGTNGKSSVADFFYQIMKLNNVKSATIGTLGVKKNNYFQKTNLTSLDIISLHKELKEIKNSKIDNVLIEASSHGLAQGRLEGINFSCGIFTNISQDHLDYHKNMKNYFNSKLILFKNILKKKSFLVTDESIPEYKTLKKISDKRKLRLKTINYQKNFEYLKKFNLIGTFQKKNLLMAILVCEILGIKKKKIFKSLNKIKSVKGRLELIRTLPNKSKVFVDFAHTPNAIKTVIKTLSEYYDKKITIVFGCGGERDKKKRKIMGKIANKLCNKIYVTDDNPRNEDPGSIRKSIIKFIDKAKLIEIEKRSKAISHSLINSIPNEIILIAGKGHESYQDYGKKIIKISDFQLVKQVRIKRKKISIKNLNLLTNQILLKELNKNINPNKGFIGVSINSKNIKKNNLFIAIKGTRTDGHNYIRDSLRRGSKYCIVSKNYNNRKNLIKVSDTKKFLNNLAILKRKKTKAKIIGITGSSGKTTVKDLIGNLLNNYGQTFYSKKSYNNHYGVPLSLCNLENNHDYGVFEIGMSKTGEIKNLSKLVKPHIGVITNVAEAHMENFKNLKEIANAKSEIINNICEDGYLIINRDGKFYNYLRKKAKAKNLKIFSFGMKKNADVYPIKVKKNYDKVELEVSIFEKRHKFSFKGHYLSNILNILTILTALKLDVSKINETLKNMSPTEGRGKIYKVKHKKIYFNLIDESYNANPLSMKESIIRFSNLNINKKRKYVLLGDMLELGDKSHILHEGLSKVINKSNIDKIFVHGKDIINTYKYIYKNKKGNILQEKSDFYETLLPLIKKNDFLMIKGSNATGLNQISKKILRGNNNAL